MRISLISSSFYPASSYGGPVSATWDLSRKLAQMGHHIYVSTTNADGSQRMKVCTNKFIEKEEGLFVKYYHEDLINYFSFSFILGVWKDIRRADVIYIQYLFHYTVLFSLIFSLIQAKSIVVCPRGSLSKFTLSNKFSLMKKLWLIFFFRPFYKSINWHASSYLEKNDIKHFFKNAKVDIINDGIEFEYFQDFDVLNRQELVKKYTQHDFNHISHVFFSMGRLHTIKCFDVLIDAFRVFANDYTHAKLLIAGGDDGMEKILQEQIIRLKLEDKVFLIGLVNRNDKRILLNNCDYFALASEFESFGLVVAEALACGRPIILSNKTPWIDLEIKKCGILVNNDVNSFVDGFSQVLKINYDSDNIRDYARSQCNWDVITKMFSESINK